MEDQFDRDKEKEKFKDLNNQLLNDKDIIPNVHNYCDRWCDKCPMTARCLVFRTQKEMGLINDEGITLDKLFWEKLSLLFEVTLEMISDTAKQLGIAIYGTDEEEVKPDPDDHEAEALSEIYASEVMKWLSKWDDELMAKREVYAMINEKKMISFKEAIDVIQWYAYFITAKIRRAYLSMVFGNNEEDGLDDKNGSAKIAIMSIDRTIEAFSVLYQLLPEAEDELLQFLSKLSAIKRLVLLSFPDAMNFKRPGFDD